MDIVCVKNCTIYKEIKMEHIYDTIIIGGGPAGYTAALYCARAGLDTLVLEKLSVGGQMALTMQIDNYPGFDEGIDGFMLGDKMKKGAERFGAKTTITEVLSVDLKSNVKTVSTRKGDLLCRTVIIATGAVPKKLSVPGESEFTGRGVSYCAACDGMFYRGKRVVIVGGGNSAAGDASLLSRVCQSVTLIHRRDTLRATKIYHEPLMKAENISFSWNSSVTEVLGDDKVTGVAVKNTVTGEISTIDCDGVFVSIGRSPETQLFTGMLDIDENGYIIADESTETTIPGVYAAGDVRTKTLRQVVTAAADGAVAALKAEEYISRL